MVSRNRNYLSYNSFSCSLVTGNTLVASESIPNLSARFFSFSSSKDVNELRKVSDTFLSRLKFVYKLK